MSSLTKKCSIAECFIGRSIFITGASGFMGKVLVEKLLRSCPGIVKIYILLRPGRKGTIQDKMDKMTLIPLFDRLRSERPGDLESKLVPIIGDVTKLNLGITDEDRALLIQEVSIVYHLAATVRFNQALKGAIIINVRGTREVCNLVLDIRSKTPNTIFLHASTAFAHSDRKVVEECMYPPHADWRRSIQIAEDLDEHTLQILCTKYTNAAQNTYVFTKSLAEHVVNDLCGAGGRTIIGRPSIVISSILEPMPGWVDNFNGPIAMMAASATGIIRISYLNPDSISDFMTVDVAIKGVLLATHNQLFNKSDDNMATVYNCTSYKTKCITTREMAEMARELIWEVALKDTLWFPDSTITNNMTWYYINFMLFQLIPAFILDGLFKIFGIKKQSLVEIQRKVYTATISLGYFMVNQWSFINTKGLTLLEELPSEEMDTFGYDIDNVDYMEFFRNATLGAKQYLMKEDMSQLDKDVAKITIFYYVDRAVKVFFYSLVSWYIFFKVDIINVISSKLFS